MITCSSRCGFIFGLGTSNNCLLTILLFYEHMQIVLRLVDQVLRREKNIRFFKMALSNNIPFVSLLKCIRQISNPWPIHLKLFALLDSPGVDETKSKQPFKAAIASISKFYNIKLNHFILTLMFLSCHDEV